MELFVYTFHHDKMLYRALSPLTPAEVEEFGLPSHAVLGQISALLPSMTPDQFEENEEFVALLQAVCRQHGASIDDLQSAARAQGTGEVALVDTRAGSVTGDVSGNDVLGVFEVRRGDIISESYRPNPDYRLLTDNGPVQLPPGLEEKLLVAIKNFDDEPISEENL